MSVTWLPATTDVGAILRARTVDDNGNELGDFTVATRPTGTEVTNLILQASRDVEALLGSATQSQQVQDMGKHLIALKTAMLIEISYFPEQVGSGKSPYEQLKDMYNDELKRTLEYAQTDGEDVGMDDNAAVTVHSFPSQVYSTSDQTQFLGMDTPW